MKGHSSYEQFERERLCLLAETNKFLEKVMSGYYCGKCKINYYDIDYCPCCKQEQKPMTRELAVLRTSEELVESLEALGLLKFDEVKKPDYNNVYKVTKEVLEAVKALIKINNKNDFVSTTVGDFVLNDEVKELRFINRIQIGKFTRVLFKDGSYSQGYIEDLIQP